MQTIIRSRRVLLEHGIEAADIVVEDGRIVGVHPRSSQDGNVHDCGDLLVMPGLVDSHVHINQPGRTHWEGFDTATRAAAAGGVTTIVDMPLNSIPATTNVAAFHEKLAASTGLLHVDVGFWGGVVPGNEGELPGLVEAGVLGFKCFLVPSGVDEFDHVRREDLDVAMPILAELDAVLLAHSELPGPIEAAAAIWDTGNPSSHRTWLKSRPAAAEVQAIQMMVELTRETGCRSHIVHLVATEALPVLKAARKEGLPVTVETCPHYLTFSAEGIGDGRTELKCAPPIRSAENRERLWEALKAGEIDFVVTDHSPSPAELKRGSFAEAWGGIASLQLLLPVTWTGARERGHDAEVLGDWLCSGPAQLAGLQGSKGRIAAGYHADLVVWDPEASFVVDAAMLQHRHPNTPYAGMTLHGVVFETWLRGQKVYDRGEFSLESGRPVLAGGSEAARLNRLQWLSDDAVRKSLLACCGSTEWANRMLESRPWTSGAELLDAADNAWDGLGPDAWLEAFEAHPRIGERKAATDRGKQASSWSKSEQSGTASASEHEKAELARLNQVYEDHFGFIFLIFASGKTTGEMLAALQSRLENDKDTELKVAAAEQHKITRLRLQKLLDEL